MKIPGLTYISDYITLEQELELVKIIDTKPWIDELKRRVQHYGYKYDYKSRSLDNQDYLGPIPDWLAIMSNKLFSDGIFERMPDQVIINEYEPGQGIAPYIDCVPCFGPTISSLSLNSNCVIDFTKNNKQESLLLEQRSLLILKNEARYCWKHSIAARKQDKHGGQNFIRGKRISLTFRTVIL